MADLAAAGESARSAWLCLCIPELALQALRPQMLAAPNSDQADLAWVVLRKVDSSQIIAVDSHAAALGISCNHSLAQARAITPKLGVLVRQAMREDALLEDLACVAYQFSHQVLLGKNSLDNDGAGNAWVSFEIAASLKLFAGLAALLDALKPLLAALMLRLQLGIAPNPEGARVLAQSAAVGHVRRAHQWPQSLNRIALIHSALAPDTTSALASMGVHDFEALLALPTSGLRKRFGADCVTYLTALQQSGGSGTVDKSRRAGDTAGMSRGSGTVDKSRGSGTVDKSRGSGTVDKSRRAGDTTNKAQSGNYWRPPQRFQRQLDFGFSAESVALLAFPIKRLLRELALYLQACDAAVQEITLTLAHQSKPATLLVVNMLSVTRDALILASLVSTKLESLRLVEGVIGISLSVQKLQASTAHTPDLFSATAAASLPLPRLLERLQNKLGTNKVSIDSLAKTNKVNQVGDDDATAVQTLHWQHEHRPELASRSQPLSAQQFLAKPGKSKDVLIDSQAMPPRPIWLITPEAIAADTFAILSGPERIESGWWDSAHLGDVRRDYYVAQLHSGTRIWIYQQRPNSKVAAAIVWYLHGYF